MKNIDQDFNTIQDYIDGNLSTEAAEEVKARLQKEPDFDRLYKRTKTAIQVVQSEAEQSTMALLKSIQASENIKFIPPAQEPQAKVRKLHPSRILSIAAVLLVLIVAAIWVFQPKSQELSAFNQYYETPAFDMQRGGQAEEQLNSVANAYNQDDFAAALNSLETYEASNGANTDTKLYRAIAHIELKQSAEALVLLNELSQGSEQLDQVYWLKALAHLQAKEKAQAIDALRSLQSGDIVITPKRKQQMEGLLDKLGG